MSEFDVWIWLKLDALRNSLLALSILSLTLGTLIVFCINITDWNARAFTEANGLVAFKKASIHFFLMSFFVCLFVLIPTTKEYAMMKIFPTVTNAELTNEIAADVPEVYKMAKEYFKEMVKGEN